MRDLDADTDRIWIERHRIVDDARDLASQLLALAETAAERFPDDVEPEPASVSDAPYDEESDEFYADEEAQETEHEASNEEEDDVLTGEAPEDDVLTGEAPEDDVGGHPGVHSDRARRG